jgi:hypothetical protein
MSDNEAPIIAPGQAPLYGQQINIVANVDPEQFPNGLELVIMVPGQLEAFGKIICPAGAMIAEVPTAMAIELRKQMKKQAPIIRAYEKAAPGFH